MVELRLTPDGKHKLGDCWHVAGGGGLEVVAPPSGMMQGGSQGLLDGHLVEHALDDSVVAGVAQSGSSGGLDCDLAELERLESAAAAAAGKLAIASLAAEDEATDGFSWSDSEAG
jgi:hypothetical protein